MAEESNPFRERLALLVPLNNLSPRQQEQLLFSAEVLNFRRKDFIFREGERDNFSFYLLAGDVEMHAGDQLIKKVSGGEGASYYPLAQLQPRQMSAVAVGNVQVLRVDRLLLDKLLSVEREPLAVSEGTIEVEEFETTGSIDWLTGMLQTGLFTRIPPANIQRLIDTLETVQCQAGQVLVKQGDPGDYYYVIQQGRCEVCRVTSTGKEIRLAELEASETFGEEALISNTKRNATVRMLTDGVLGRLTQANFLELISQPLLRRVSLAEATAAVTNGARWLDVRFPEEHRENGIPGSLNVPLTFLRSRIKDLDPSVSYIAYCDSGGRSSTATFLLMQEGFDVSFVGSGAIDELGKASPPKAVSAPQPPPKPVPAPSPPPDRGVESEVQAQALTAEVERARIQIAQAERLMAEATAAKRDAERLVAEKLQSERARLDAEAAMVQTRLAEAQRLKTTLEAQQAAAQAEAERQRAAQEARAAELQGRIDQALREKEQRLEEVFRAQTARLEQLQAEHTQTKKSLDDTWQQIELESQESKARLESAQRLEQELKAREAAQAAAIAAQEQALRAALKEELARERARFQAEVAESVVEIAQARQAREAAIAAKDAAAAEAQQVIAEFKRAQQELAEQQNRLLVERQALVAEAERLRQDAAVAESARMAAETARQAVENELQAALQRQSTNAQTEAQLRADIEALRARATVASRDLTDAIALAAATNERQRANADRLERTLSSETELNHLLRRELDDWVGEQERIQNSTAQRADLARRMAHTSRIRERAAAAKQAAESTTFSLLDEIASKLGEDL